MDQELTEEDGTINMDIKPQYSAIANVSCQYDGTPGKFQCYKIHDVVKFDPENK